MRSPSSSVVLAGCLLGLVALAGVLQPRPESDSWCAAAPPGSRALGVVGVARGASDPARGSDDSSGPARSSGSARSAWARHDLRECKPRGPLAVTLEQLAPWGDDGRFEVSVDVATFLPLGDVRVRVLLPDGGELLDDPSDLLAADGGWGELLSAVATPDGAARFGASTRGLGTQDGTASVGDEGCRALLPGERADGRLVLRLPTGAPSQELVVEAEGTFVGADGLDERVVVQRRLVWGEPADPITSDVLTDRTTGARRRQVVLPVLHRPER